MVAVAGRSGLKHRGLVASALAMILVVGVFAPGSASADPPATTAYDCAAGPLALPLDLEFQLDETPDPVQPLAQFSAAFTTGLPVIPGIPPETIGITGVEVVLPIPANVASIDALALSGGSGWDVGTSSATEDGTNITVVLTADAGQTLASFVPPTLDITATAADAPGATIDWLFPTTLVADVLLAAAPLSAVCSVVDDTVLLAQTGIGTPVVTTTTTSTTVAPTSTTEATTTTTAAAQPQALTPTFTG